MGGVVMRAAVVLAMLAASPAGAQSLTAAMAAPVTSMDPHFYNAAPNNGVAMHIFERLTGRDAQARLIPELADSWKPVGETVWEFKLHPGVKWSDGVPFTPDDVAFTMGRVPNVPNSPGGFVGLIRAVQRVEIVDATTIRFHTPAPSPNLPGDIAGIGIIARHAAEGASTQDYNSGKAAIGTGPYKLVRYVNGDRIELVRNEAYWGAKPEWEKVTYRFIPNSGARTAALLSGDVDLIDVPPAPDLPRLQADPKLHVVSTQGLRLIFLALDFAHAGEVADITDNAGGRLAKNPLLDLRVRQALSVAINRAAIAERVMGGTAAATGQWLPPGTFGYAPNVKPPEYAPEKAKALLAAAGYPAGFKLVLHTPNDRYPNDAATAQAVAQMWSRVGVQTSVEALPWASYSTRSSKQEFAVGLLGWGSNTAEAAYTLINILGTWDPASGRGASNNGRYANAALDAATDRALATIDDAARSKLLIEAVTMATDDVPIIPLHQLVNYWASKKSVSFTPRSDERTLARDAHLNK